MLPTSSLLVRAAVLVAILSAFSGSYAQSGPQTPFPDIEPIVRARAVDLAAGEQHSIAVLDDGSVWTWGQNSDGELSRVVTTDDYLVPVRIRGVTGRWAAAGTSTSYVYDGVNLLTAGYNSTGRLGYGPTGSEEAFSSRPFPGLVEMEASGDHIVALKGDSTVWVWGAGSAGSLNSNGRGPREQVEPLRVPGLRQIVSVSAGGGFSLVLREDGTVWAWGLNNYGTLGNLSVASYAGTTQTSTSADGSSSASSSGAPSRTFSETPVRVAIDDVMAIAAGEEHALAVRADSTVWGWGKNERGTLGLTSADAYVLAPMPLPGLTGVVAVGAGSGYSLALKADGTLWMWGIIDGMYNYDEPYGRPRRVPLLPRIVAIEAGSHHAFAISEDGHVWGWGLSDMGQVGAEASEGETDWPPLPIRFNR